MPPKTKTSFVKKLLPIRKEKSEEITIKDVPEHVANELREEGKIAFIKNFRITALVEPDEEAGVLTKILPIAGFVVSLITLILIVKK